MSLTLDGLRDLARQAIAFDDAPTNVDVTEVVPFLDSEDRNVRVAALRVLAFADGEVAVRGILRGFDDTKKRVRDVAVKSSVRFTSDPRVVTRLQDAVTRDESTASLALMILGGIYASAYGLAATEPITHALAPLTQHATARRHVLVSLLRARDLSEPVKELLRGFVVDGSKEEAVLATRRLCGFRVMRPEEMTDEQRARAERAFGQVWFWVRMD